jgi:ABC-type polysaccharide/polyol phosphate transport system ATPase subunit
MKPVIELEGVSKYFELSRGASGSLKATALGVLKRRPKQMFTALDNVSFHVEQGETLGVIGHNGAGKSTLLSLVAGVMYPSTGTIRTTGRISSLLELGAGFHPDLTGRENVYLYGAVMGIPRARMRERFDAIVEFAGIGEFIDQPVKHYSSGMYVRLGFAVAVQVEPDILLVDEVLAVGDETFQQRCIEHMKAFRKAGKTLLIVSHDLELVQRMSDRIVLLAQGGTRSMGAPGEIIGSYRAASAAGHARDLVRQWGTGRIMLKGIRFLDDAGREVSSFRSGSALHIQMEYECKTRVDTPVFGYSISDRSGRMFAGSNTQIGGVDTSQIGQSGVVTLSLRSLPLIRSEYMFSFSVHSPDHKIQYHRLDCSYALGCEGETPGNGILHIPAEWRIQSA